MHHRLTLAVAFALAVIALASPAANARADGPIDLRSPDARDAARPAAIDLRSPDARDAARFTPPRGPSFAVMTAGERRTVHHEGGTDWNDVALIGGGAIAVLALGLGTAVSVRRRETAIPR